MLSNICSFEPGFHTITALIKSFFADDVTIAICPGIGNTSESVYVRTFVHYAQCHGYRCAVLNHVGALHTVPVTAPRIFSYGMKNNVLNVITKIGIFSIKISLFVHSLLLQSNRKLVNNF